MRYLILSILLFSQMLVFAQQQANHEKKAFIDSTGRYYQQASLPVYFYVSSSPDQAPSPIKFADKQMVMLEGHGIHKFGHENYLTQKNESIEIYADGKAPITTSEFLLAPKYISKEQTFYGPGLQVALSSIDEMSGVEAIYHSINKNEFAIKTMEKTSFDTEGSFVYHYYSLDRTGNVEVLNTKQFIVDLSAPETFHNFVSISSENVISTNSTIYLDTNDGLAGVASTFYKFDEEEYKPYSGGNINFKYLADGYHTITYYSVDQVKNEEKEKNFEFYIDKTAPIMSADIIGDKFLVEDKVYFSGRTKLKITAVDNKSGIKQIKYTIDKGEEQEYHEPFYLPNVSGIHNVDFYAIDNTNNPTKDDFKHSVGIIYVDLTGPSLTHTFTGPSFVKAETVFISPATKIVLTAKDPEAGLKTIGYKLGNHADSIYAKPFSVSEKGNHILQYFGQDNVNNKNSLETRFVVDGTGPEITYQFATSPGNDGKYPSYSTIFLAAMDTEVGAERIVYSINGEKEQPYNSPIKGFQKDKEYTLKIKSYDLLNNESETEFTFKTETF